MTSGPESKSHIREAYSVACQYPGPVTSASHHHEMLLEKDWLHPSLGKDYPGSTLAPSIHASTANFHQPPNQWGSMENASADVPLALESSRSL